MQTETPTPVPAALIAANAATLATLVPIALHQLGALHHLPDPPSRLFDSDGITESKAAHPLGVPDALLGLGSFGLTLALAVAAKSNPKFGRYLAWKLAGDTAFAGFNLLRQGVQFRKLCSWCTGTALCAFTAAAVGAPLLREEYARLRTDLQ